MLANINWRIFLEGFLDKMLFFKSLLERMVVNIFTSNLKKLKNKHKGETCYIFGGGMSIKEMDLTQFSEYPAIATNMLVFHKDFNSLDIRYVTIVEPWYFAPPKLKPVYARNLKRIVDRYKKIVMCNQNIIFFASLSNKFLFSSQNLYYVFRGYPAPQDQADEKLLKFDLFDGSFHASLSLANFLGFRRVILIGFDAFTIQPPKTGTFYQYGPGRPLITNNFGEEFLKVLKKKMDIYTVGVDGKSFNCTYIDYPSYTGLLPAYRENDELISDSDLSIINEGYENYYKNLNYYNIRKYPKLLRLFIDYFK
jgi:hypothetical protein